jgi:hypothetical protein
MEAALDDSGTRCSVEAKSKPKQVVFVYLRMPSRFNSSLEVGIPPLIYCEIAVAAGSEMQVGIGYRDLTS